MTQMPHWRNKQLSQKPPQGDNLKFYPPPLEVFRNYRHRFYLLICFTRQIVVVESCSCRIKFLVLFRSPKSKIEHSAVRLRLKTSTKNHPFLSATYAPTTKIYSNIIKYPLSRSIAKFFLPLIGTLPTFPLDAIHTCPHRI